MLWNKNFTLLTLANLLLHVAAYSLFPLVYRWLIYEWHVTSLMASVASVAFGFSLCLPGIFNNYLVDTFSRKRVATYSIFVMALAGLLYPYLTSLWMVVMMRVLQGAVFGIALMATGSTLVIDVTSSSKRNAANRVFTWASVLGIGIGLTVGLQGEDFLAMEYLLYASAACCGIAGLLISMVEVCFRAPLNLPLCSTDRFILFRTLLPGINLLVVPFVLGVLFASIPDTFFYLCMTGGFLVYLLIRQLFRAPMSGRLQVLIGQLLTFIGLSLLMLRYSVVIDGAGGVLVGLGTGFSLGQFLRMMVLLPLHCERGSGYHTFQMLWHAGMMCGFIIPGWLWRYSALGFYHVAMIVCLCGFLFYQIYIHGYFTRHMEGR